MTEPQNTPPKTSIDTASDSKHELLCSTILEVQQTLYKLAQAQIPNDPIATKVSNFNSALVTSGTQLVLEFNRLEKAGHCNPFTTALAKTVVNGVIYGALGHAGVLPIHTIDACMEALIGEQAYQQSIEKLESMRSDVIDDLTRKRQPDESIWAYIWRIKHNSDQIESFSDALAVPTTRKFASELNQKIEKKLDTGSNSPSTNTLSNTSSNGSRIEGTNAETNENLISNPIPNTGTYTSKEYHPDPKTFFQPHPITQIPIDVKIQGGSGTGIGVEVGMPILGAAADVAAAAIGIPIWPVSLVIGACVFGGILLQKKNVNKETKKIKEKYKLSDTEFNHAMLKIEMVNTHMEAFGKDPKAETVELLLAEIANGIEVMKQAAAKANERQGEIDKRYAHLDKNLREQAKKDFQNYIDTNRAFEHELDEYKIYFEGVRLLMHAKPQDCLNLLNRVLPEKKSFKHTALVDALRVGAHLQLEGKAPEKSQLLDDIKLISELQNVLQVQDWGQVEEVLSKIETASLREKLKESLSKDIDAIIQRVEASQSNSVPDSAPQIQLASYSPENRCFAPEPDSSPNLHAAYFDTLMNTCDQQKLKTLGSEIQEALQLNPDDYELRLSYTLWLCKMGQYVYALKASKILHKQNPYDLRVRAIEGTALYKLGLDTGLEILQSTRRVEQNNRLINEVLLEHVRNELKSMENTLPEAIDQLDRTGILPSNAREIYQALDDPEKIRSILNQRNALRHEVSVLEKDLNLAPMPLDSDEHAPVGRSESIVHESEAVKAACQQKKQEMGARFGVFYAETAELIFWAFCQVTHITAGYSMYGQQAAQYLKYDAKTIPNDILGAIHLWYMTELESLLAVEFSRTKQALTTAQFANVILRLLNSLVFENPKFAVYFNKEHKAYWALFHKNAEWVLPLAIQGLSLWLRDDSPLKNMIQGSPGMIIHIPGIDWILKAGPDDLLGLSRFFLYQFLVRCNSDRLIYTKDFLTARSKTIVSWAQYFNLDKMVLPLTQLWGMGYVLETTGYTLQYFDAYAFKYTYLAGVTTYYLWEDWRMHSIAIMERNPQNITCNHYWLGIFKQYGKAYHASSYKEALLYLRALMVSHNSLRKALQISKISSESVQMVKAYEEEPAYIVKVMLATLTSYETINGTDPKAQKRLDELKQNLAQLEKRFETQPQKLNLDLLYTAVLLAIWHIIYRNTTEDLEFTKAGVLQALLSSFDRLQRDYHQHLSRTQFNTILEDIQDDYKILDKDKNAIEKLTKNLNKIGHELISAQLETDKEYIQVLKASIPASEESHDKRLASMAGMLLFWPPKFKRESYSTQACTPHKPAAKPHIPMTHQLGKMSVFQHKTSFPTALLIQHKKFVFTKQVGLFCLGSAIFSYWAIHRLYHASTNMVASIKEDHAPMLSVQFPKRP